MQLGAAIQQANAMVANRDEEIRSAVQQVGNLETKWSKLIGDALKKVSRLESKRAELVRMKEMKEEKALNTDLSYHPDLVDILPPSNPERIYTMHVAGVPAAIRERNDFCLSSFFFLFYAI